MQFTQGSSLHQTYFATLDDVVIISADNAARLINAFIDNLDLQIRVWQYHA
jgi:hypothetical protein